MTEDEFWKEVEQCARYLCEQDGQDPDSYYNDFNRSAAASVTHLGEYDGWEDDVFPRIYKWTEYHSHAYNACVYFLKSGREEWLHSEA